MALHTLFLLSGATALAYEVLWMRRFSVLLGATAPAVAAALTAFFAGLGLGSYLLGRLAPRLANPLRLFAALEIATGLSALTMDPLLQAIQPVYASLYEASGDRAGLRLTLKMALAVVAVIVPSTCMGGTLPVLSQFHAERAQTLGVRAGGLYAANTLGAALGALAVPVLLLPSLGAAGALRSVVATSLAIGAGALFLRGRTQGAPAARSRAARVEKVLSTPRGAVPLAFASGAIALAVESLATRAFALIHENSVYSFATVVAVFLAGLAAGAALARAALGRGVPARRLVAIGWAAAGAWMVIFPAWFVRLTGLDYLAEGRALAPQVHLSGVAAAMLLVPSVLLGLALPALMQEQGETAGQSGPAVGAILAANTMGAIVGAPLALFALAPLVGLWTAVAAVGALSIACAAIAARGGDRLGRRAAPAAAVLALAAFVAVPPGSMPRITVSPAERLLAVREGAFGTVAVIERDGHRRMKLNNFYVLGGSAAAGDERLQGHLPLLVHPAPARVVYLGLGTGISLSAVRFHPVRDALALELVPEVAGAARQWFAGANLDVLADPRVRVRAEDARSFIAATHDRFDVVVGDLVVPWRRGESALYTRDSFEAVRRVLAPNGVYCQWVPLHQVSEDQFDSIAASFLDVFPRTTLWRGDFSAGQAVVALIGHIDPRGLDAKSVDRRSGALAERPDRSNPYLSHPAGAWLYFVGPLDRSDERFRIARRNVDGDPWVELASSPLHFRGDDSRRLTPFIGRPLKARLDAIRSRPLTGTTAASLTTEHLEWRARGAEIWDASLLSYEGDNAAADRLALTALARLPSEIQVAVLGGPAPRP